MRLLLIRHGETVDNVAQVYAGSRDSVLTSHGVSQAQRLGAHLSKNGVRLSHIFASDLQRAYRTAEAIRTAQPHADNLKVHSLKALREQDFGIFEGKPFNARPRVVEKPKAKTGDDPAQDQNAEGIESKESLAHRLDEFLDEHLWKLAEEENQKELIVAIVSHGISLAHLWRRILIRMTPAKITSAPGVIPVETPVSIEHIGAWSNTGCLELQLILADTDPKADDFVSASQTLETRSPTGTSQHVRGNIHITAVNSVIHLQGLKRTRGGVGSAAHDEGQRKLDSFFIKRSKPNPK